MSLVWSMTGRVHQRRGNGSATSFGGPLMLWWVNKRWCCAESLCGRATFTECTDQVQPYARLSTRLEERIVTALSREVRAVDPVAADVGVS